jgi:hypothetical protein
MAVAPWKLSGFGLKLLSLVATTGSFSNQYFGRKLCCRAMVVKFGRSPTETAKVTRVNPRT